VSTATSGDFHYLETFNLANYDSGLDESLWEVTSIYFVGMSNVNHTSSSSSSKSVDIAYTSDLTTTSSLSVALIFTPPQPLAEPFFIDGWAMVDNLPVNETAQLVVWVRDAGNSDWYVADTPNVSIQYWYNFSIEVNNVAPSGQIDAIAYTANRSDNPTYSGTHNNFRNLRVDDLYVYVSPDDAPRCDGSYPYNTIGRDVENPGDGWWITYPIDKPCPPGVTVPNNFWGMLLSAFTYILDQVTAFAPIHQVNAITQVIESVLIFPAGTFFVYLTALFDFTIPFWAIGIGFGVITVDWLFKTYLLIKKLIPFIN